MTPRKITFLAAALSALFLLLLEPAAAENRLALVIGNNNYVHINKLTRAANDARAVGKVLATLGFSVTTGVDLDSKTLRREVRDFGRMQAVQQRVDLVQGPVVECVEHRL